MSRERATAVGFIAVLLWSFLALFTVGSAPVPPLQLNAICFAIGGSIGIAWVVFTNGITPLLQVRWTVIAFGTLGVFGYHVLYFSALRMAPAAEAGLIAYLWPLLIVLFSGLLPGESLKRGHIIGAVVSFVGAALLILGGGSGFSANHLVGYLLAFACALTWSGYSVMSRRFGDVPTASVAIFCLLSAILSYALHLGLEETIWPDSTIGWASIIALGAGPVGLAFYVWDIGVKRGNIQLLGTSSYAAPLFSTVILVLAGIASLSWSLVLAAVLITGGAWIAARSDA